MGMRTGVTLLALMGMVAAAQSAIAQNENDKICAAGPYIVYFDADSAIISPSSAEILDDVVRAYQGCGPVQITISGHTDRMGEERYNVGLSQRMAISVRNHLATKGISNAVMTTEAFGEIRPRVTTGDGVSEALNRRVEIRIGPPRGW